MTFKGKDINISFTNANVLDAIDKVQKEVKPILDKMKDSKDMKAVADDIRAICSIIGELADACGIDREELLPDPDFLDYFGFLNAVIEEYHNFDFKSVALVK